MTLIDPLQYISKALMRKIGRKGMVTELYRLVIYRTIIGSLQLVTRNELLPAHTSRTSIEGSSKARYVGASTVR